MRKLYTLPKKINLNQVKDVSVDVRKGTQRLFEYAQKASALNEFRIAILKFYSNVFISYFRIT
jgi:hypothetical protein